MRIFFYSDKCISLIMYHDMGMTRGNVCFYLEKCISLIMYNDMGMTLGNVFIQRNVFL